MTGIGSKITLNCDMRESSGLYKMGVESMFHIVDLANVECGFHASDSMIMGETVKKAKSQGISVGAHISFPDLQGFGRREMKLTPQEITDAVMNQVGALNRILDNNNMKLSHIKPHESLYGVAARDETVCKAIVDAVKTFDVPLVGMAGTCHETIAKECEIPFIAEFFADLEYDDNGRLIVTRTQKAVNPKEIASKVKRALESGKVKSINDKDTDVQVNTICVHSDTPDAVEVARAVRSVVDTFNMKGGKNSTNSIRKILVANRGEIACRVMKTCENMGIKTVAIYEAADDNSRHIALADESVELPSGSTYTSIEAIVQISKSYRVDAVHPGYGFLSENPIFGKALKDAGITFLGPTPEVMEAFGLKHSARELATGAGVPVVPGTSILENIEDALKQANRLTYPVILKATGGGGGIGMQICNDSEALTTAFTSCQTLAEKYFGNAGVYMEKYYPLSRHIEIQVFGNGLGDAVHLGERECSVQRRNQKVIEETPSPFLNSHETLRRNMYQAAVKLASQMKYQSAGTVEFLVVDEGESSENTGKFYFLEMNTRLQVEHGVTELTNGVDLVEWMILQGNAQRANKGGLDLSSYHWLPSGHAMEVRVYAENPVRNFQPSPGLLTMVQWPDDKTVRVDTWVETGTRINPLYDPLIAKVLVLGKDRESTTNKMSEALRNSTVAGPYTNIEYLQEVLKCDHFTCGNTTTQILSKVQFVPNAVEVIQGGIETTVQDFPGRMALRVYGINPSGPMDDLAFKIANLLVGNEIGTSGLEITLRGPQLMFHRPCTIAITGAPMQLSFKASRNAPSTTFPMWSKVCVPAGGIVSVGRIPKGGAGCRCYMAIAGGLDIPDYLGSKSTFPAFHYGGFQGRPLQSGDMIPLVERHKIGFHSQFSVELVLPSEIVPTFEHFWNIKAMSGPHSDPDYITTEGMYELFSADWKVHYNSNRLGVRMVGPTPKWTRPDGGEGGNHPSNLHDCGYVIGSINFTGDSPVILTGEGPTLGGFACPLTILSCELWKVGQVNPGDIIRFSPVSYEDAIELRSEYKTYLDHVHTFVTHYPMTVPVKLLRNITKVSAASPSKADRKSPILLELSSKDIDIRPTIQYLQAGECNIMIEYGDPNAPLDLNMRARVKVLQDTLRLETDTETRLVKDPLIPGTLDAIPCTRSLLIRFDPDVVPQGTLLQYLVKLEDQIPDCSKMVFPSRELRLPLAFDDQWTRGAIQRYMTHIRKEACYLPSNVEFVAKNNGLSGGKQDVCDTLTYTPWLVVGIGFFVGCPNLVPLHPLRRVTVPKYNPARTFTVAGTVGLGGSMGFIYAMESPGGYQMCGRTVPTWDMFGTIKPFSPSQPWLLQMFDQVIFNVVSEGQLAKDRKLALAGKYSYKITETTFDMAKQNKLANELKDEVGIMLKRQKEARLKMLAIEAELLKKQTSIIGDLVQSTSHELPDNQFGVEAGMFGCVKNILVSVGDQVIANETALCTLVAMKAEMAVTSDENGTVVKIMVSETQQVEADTVICILAETPH